LNLVGIIVPGERITAISGRSLSYRDGVPRERAEAAHDEQHFEAAGD
jgi:hypothetical protein